MLSCRRRRFPSFVCALNLAVVCGVAVPARAQDHDNPHAARPERPVVSLSTETVSPGWVEVEAGLEVDHFPDRRDGDASPVMIKLGLTDRLHVAVQEAVIRAPGVNASGVGDLAFAVKWRFVDHLPVLGSLAVVPTLKLPTGSVRKHDGTGTTDGAISLASTHHVGPLAVDATVGFTRRSGDGSEAPQQASVWSAAVSGPFARGVGWTSEVFGFPATSGPAGEETRTGAIAAVTFRVREWLVLDGGVLLAISGPQPHAVFGGVVYNIGHIGRHHE